MKALENVLEDLMDDAVRAEVVRIKAARVNKNGREKIKYGTRSSADRQALLQDIADALSNGDMNRAKALRERFSMLTDLKADHTQAQGSYDKYLDQDEWYMEARQRAMAPAQKTGNAPSSWLEEQQRKN